jgi:hypothetical protein
MISVAFAAVAAVLATAGAQDNHDVMTFGMGSMSCDYWQSDGDRRREGEAWLLGYWSGLNRLNLANGAVGGEAGGQGVINQVQTICRDHGDQRLEQAVYAAYVALQSAHR